MTIKQVCAEGGVSRNMAGPLHTLYLREGKVVGEDGWEGPLCVCL